MKRCNDRGREGRNNKKKTQHQQQPMPHDLIIEVLLRLPVKSLVRFNCVCKSWFSLISDPHFATSHFNLITAAPTHCQRLMIFTTMPATETRFIDFEASSLNDPTAIASMNPHFLIPRSDLNLKIGGSCRGFIFLHSRPDLYLWNPSTGIHKQIPPSPIVSGLKKPFFTYLYGLGYDPSTDDYLVVIGSTDVTPSATDFSTHFEFFSLRANTWKVTKSADLSYLNAFYNPGVGTLFNGAIHWLTTCVDTSVKVLLAFDLTERTISETPLPDISDFFDVPMDSNLWVFGGLLSLWATMDNDTVEIWVMKEYSAGVHSSWTKTIVISVDDDTRFFYPICSTSSSDIVGSIRNTGLVKYNANGQLIEHRSYCNQHPDQSQVALYTESLLSLPLPWDTEQA